MRRLHLVLGLVGLAVIAWIVLRPGTSGPSPERETDSSPAASSPVENTASGSEGGIGFPSGDGGVSGIVTRSGTPVAARITAWLRLKVDLPEVKWSRISRERDRIDLNLTPIRPIHAHAGEDGRFVIEGLSPGNWEIVARAEDGAAP